ncbi:MAG: GNAT family N-acetyltransferase [Bacteroidales bacterium]|nr:GNAT family N-acetyltransferase [Bacteroidales bacterium]
MSGTIEFSPIRVEPADWPGSHATLTAIRHQVFVAEQGVPPEAEIDSDDPAALHWLALDAHAAPMGTARLVGNRVGRMAVLGKYRGKGVGSSLLRAIIKHASGAGMDTLVLDAQTHALGFYERFGFVTCGEVFDDVGIPHRPMRLELRRFDRSQPAAPAVGGDLRHRIALDGSQAFADAALDLAGSAEHAIRLFSQRLDPRLYDRDDFCEVVLRVATRHPNTEVRILVRDTSHLLRHNHRLVELFMRLSSRMELRRLDSELETPHTEFLVSDEKGILCNQLEDGYRGYCYRHAPLEARHLSQDFDALWHRSGPAPGLRRLYL